MDAMQAILTRRSIRQYTRKPVPDAILKELLAAAMSAPSAGNQQPWHFIVIDDREILDRVPGIHPYSHSVKSAPVAILVCGDLNLEIHKDFWIQDCSAATENILIAVQANGLGAVWLGIYPREERVRGMKNLFNLPRHVIPFSLISIGYPAEIKAPAGRFNDSRIHYNRWI
jgi:nitroreductase